MRPYLQNKLKSWLWAILAGLVTLSSSSCSNTRRLADDQSLLTRNNVIIDEENFLDKNEMKNELKRLSRQQPNRKFLGLWRLRLSTYNVTTKKHPHLYTRPDQADTTQQNFSKWLRTKIGEPPVLFDASLMHSSTIRMQQHLFNNGYFNAKVSSEHRINRKRARVRYFIDPGEPHYIDQIEYSAEDSALHLMMQQRLNTSLLETGDRYVARKLDAERTRITNDIQDAGYFTFNRNYIFIEVDTFRDGRLADIYFKIRNPEDKDIHQKYYIGNVFFTLNVPERRLKRVDLSRIDTFNIREVTAYLPDRIVNPKPVVRSIFFTEDSLYRKSNYNETLRRLNSLDIFRTVNVKFDPYQVNIGEGLLDTYVNASLRKKQTFSIENEWNTDARQSLGLELSTSYINRNILRSANRFEFNLAGGLELQLKNTDETSGRSRVNTVELRSNLRFKFPELTIPYRRKKEAQPVLRDQFSAINLDFEYERRLGLYTINKATLSWQHSWMAGKNIRHLLEVPALSLVAPRERSFSAAFLQTLETYPALKRSFEPQLIASLINYAFIYNGQFRRERHLLYFRGNVKSSGNVIHSIKSAIRNERTTPYHIIGIDYSQFLRLETDFRHYLNFRSGGILATRLSGGIGIAYGNLDVLPFTEQFYGGGNQSMRGWRYRGLGPGGFDTRTITGLSDQSGDIRLEFNTEFRFTIYRMVRAAIFLDAGNVWMLRRDDDRQDAEFRIRRSAGRMNSFVDELALNFGVGLRLDFTYFVIRLDAGLPIRDPAFEDGQRWQFDKIDLSRGSAYRDRVGMIIAIGYPF